MFSASLVGFTLEAVLGGCGKRAQAPSISLSREDRPWILMQEVSPRAQGGR